MNPARDNNAIAMAKTPVFDALWNNNPHTTLRADGLFVGLPPGQFGNSEVGHMNIGAGRTVMQELPRITLAVNDGSLARNDILLDFIAQLKKSGGRAHLMGLVSDGGVHAHMDHVAALARIVSSHGVPVMLHIFTDGRDTPPASAASYVTRFLHDIGDAARVGTVTGRFYAMDRDNRWERVSAAWQAIVNARGVTAPDAATAISQSYANGEQDEFVKPTVIAGYDGFKPHDGIIMGNYRTDRAREILRALMVPQFTDFDRGAYTPPAHAIGMVDYADDLNALVKTMFPPQPMDDLLGDIVSRAGKTQLRAAETEKYPHVTFFFNGGRETPYAGEERLLVPSPKVATYDLQPEMSAIELTDKLIAHIESGAFDFIVLNYANPDMVGHTGSIPAAIAAVETVDTCLGRVRDAIAKMNGTLIVTADHGNADQMVDPQTSQPHTAHTTFPVPFIVSGAGNVALRDGGCLGDIAPTILKLLNIPQPAAMTGKSLITG